jgi:hypothetical protein
VHQVQSQLSGTTEAVEQNIQGGQIGWGLAVVHFKQFFKTMFDFVKTIPDQSRLDTCLVTLAVEADVVVTCGVVLRRRWCATPCCFKFYITNYNLQRMRTPVVLVVQDKLAN